MIDPHFQRGVCSIAVALLLATSAHAAPASGDRYQVTSKFEIKDMPFPMPNQTTEVCTAKDGGDASMVPKDKNCRVLDYKKVGNRSSFRMECSGKDAMSGDGETELLGAGAYRGRISARSMSGGEAMDMTIRFEGKRIGDCDYASESPAAQGAALLKQTCESQLDVPAAYAMFTGAGATCAAQRAAFCSRIGTQADTLGNPANFPANELAFPWQAFEACGRPRATIVAKACASAKASANLGFIGQHCPTLVVQACESADARKDTRFIVNHCAEKARMIAAEQCQGRGYTAMRTSPYRDFCSQQAATRVRERNVDAPAANEAAAPTAEPARKPGLRERLKNLKDRASGD